MEDFGSLKVFRELTLTGSPEKFQTLGDAIERLLPEHWTRSRQKDSNNLSYFGPDDKPLLVFERSAAAQLPAAGLVMLGVGRTIKVINIVPIKTHQLSTDHYNAILMEFANVAVRPAAESLDLAFQISTDSHRQQYRRARYQSLVIGRKNWLFADSVSGAHTNAIMYSLVETAKANGLNPFDYLTYVIETMPTLRKANDIQCLLPWNIPQPSLMETLIAA